jgi:hypothetical protein
MAAPESRCHGFSNGPKNPSKRMASWPGFSQAIDLPSVNRMGDPFGPLMNLSPGRHFKFLKQ